LKKSISFFERPYAAYNDTSHGEKGFVKHVFHAVAPLSPENVLLRTSKYTIASEKIPTSFDGFRIAQISDLHGNASQKSIHRLMREIRNFKPDAVVITGDFVDEWIQDFAPLFRFIDILCEECPVYFAYGNHEQELPGKMRRSFLKGLQKRGVHVLDNASEQLKRNGESLTFCGIRVPLRFYRWKTRGLRKPTAFTKQQMESLVGQHDKASFTVLLAHNPLFFETYAEWGAELTLSGHVHGGMVRLPYFGGLLSPERKFFPKYSAGLYNIKNKQLIVSTGLGKYPRLNNPPELVLITLRHASRTNTGKP
jgi:predicted MPP superfamily phosphohydrolase